MNRFEMTEAGRDIELQIVSARIAFMSPEGADPVCKVQVIASHPDRIAAAVPVCGMWKPDEAAKMKSVPVWAFHGADDPTVPVSGSREMIAALKTAGATPKYTEYPSVGHSSWLKAYATAEMWDWMFAQRREPIR